MTSFAVEPLGETEILEKDFPDWDEHVLSGGFSHRLYPTVAPDHRDASFRVLGPDGTVLLARCTVGKDDISFFGLPLVLSVRQGIEGKAKRKILSFALDHIAELGRAAGIDKAVIGDKVSEEPGTLGTLCIDRQAKAEPTAWIVADLSQDEVMLKRDIRDSYRSLINWGERNITFRLVDRDAADRELFDQYGAFHAKIAGRSRGAEYWEVFWQEILRGKAELLLGWLADGTLAAGLIVIGAGRTAYYASGVYARDQFDKPLGHWLLWLAMLRAKEQGYRWFDVGESFDRWHGSDKEANIAFFKRGFSARRMLRMRWILPVS